MSGDGVDACMVMTTCGNTQEAEAIAAHLLANKLAACIQVAGITSHFVWEGKRTTEEERLLLIKTRLALYPKVEAAILALHKYEVPEVTCVALRGGSPSYLGWIANVTSEP